MTADIKLLPLYAELQGHPKLELIKHYARANVARHTAAQAAEIDALRTRLEDTVRDGTNEIEALRAEVGMLREALGRILENEASDYKAAEEFGGYVLDDELREEARSVLSMRKDCRGVIHARADLLREQEEGK